MTKRLDTLHIPSTAETRRAYRAMLLTTPDRARSVSEVISNDKTTRQTSQRGAKLVEALAHAGIMPGRVTFSYGRALQDPALRLGAGARRVSRPVSRLSIIG